jgi:hypothetical protein
LKYCSFFSSEIVGGDEQITAARRFFYDEIFDYRMKFVPLYSL